MHKRWVYSLINSNTREDVWSHHTEQDIEYLPHPRRLPYAPSQQSLPPFLLKRDSRVKEVSGCLGNQELIWRVWNPMGAVESQATECPVPAHPGPPSAPVMAGFLSARRSADSSEHILVSLHEWECSQPGEHSVSKHTEKVSIHRITITFQSSVSAIIPR